MAATILRLAAYGSTYNVIYNLIEEMKIKEKYKIKKFLP